MSDRTFVLLWNLGAYFAVAALAKLIALGILMCLPRVPRPDAGAPATIWSGLGLSWQHWPRDIGLGLTTFIWLTPVVLGIHAACSIVLWDRPHALTALDTAKLSNWQWTLVALQVCLAAPVIEEFLFRGLVQYWLQKTSLWGHAVVVVATLVRAAYAVSYHDATADVDVVDGGPVIFAVLVVAGYIYGLFRLKFLFALSAAEVRAWNPIFPEGAFLATNADVRKHDALREQEWHRFTSMLAIYGSAMLFAILHVNAWPAPIALFVMGCGLGMLARTTQSLIGPIVFHSAFNLVAFIALYGTSP